MRLCTCAYVCCTVLKYELTCVSNSTKINILLIPHIQVPYLYLFQEHKT